MAQFKKSQDISNNGIYVYYSNFTHFFFILTHAGDWGLGLRQTKLLKSVDIQVIFNVWHIIQDKQFNMSLWEHLLKIFQVKVGWRFPGQWDAPIHSLTFNEICMGHVYKKPKTEPGRRQGLYQYSMCAVRSNLRNEALKIGWCGIVQDRNDCEICITCWYEFEVSLYKGKRH